MLCAAPVLQKMTYDGAMGTVVCRSKMHSGLKRNLECMLIRCDASQERDISDRRCRMPWGRLDAPVWSKTNVSLDRPSLGIQGATGRMSGLLGERVIATVDVFCNLVTTRRSLTAADRNLRSRMPSPGFPK